MVCNPKREVVYTAGGGTTHPLICCIRSSVLVTSFQLDNILELMMRLAIAFFVLVSHGPFCAGQEDPENFVAVSRPAIHASNEFKVQITGEGKITRDEFLASLERVFEKLDMNSDHQLDSFEYSMPGLIPPADANLDGVLSVNEYRNHQVRQFSHLNIPTGISMVGNPEASLATESDNSVLSSINGGATLQMSPELLEQNGIVALALHYEVAGVSKAFRQPVLNFSKKIKIPLAEVLDLSCGTVNWSPYKEQGLVGTGDKFLVDKAEQWGRTEYVLRVDDKVIGMVGIIGSNSMFNPRYHGNAMAQLSLDEGSLFLNVLPPVEGSGGAAFRVIVAPVNEQQKPAFRFLLGSADLVPQPDR